MPDRLTVRQQLVEARDLAAEGQKGEGGGVLYYEKIWALLVAAIEDIDPREPLPSTQQALAEIERLETHLHNQMNYAEGGLRGHPDFEYTSVEIGRKSCEDPRDKLEGEGWEENFVGEGNHHDAWDRGDYTEDHCFRRRKPVGSD